MYGLNNVSGDSNYLYAAMPTPEFCRPAAIFSTCCNFITSVLILACCTMLFSLLEWLLFLLHRQVLSLQKGKRCVVYMRPPRKGWVVCVCLTSFKSCCEFCRGVRHRTGRARWRGAVRRKKRDSGQIFHKHVHLLRWYTPKLVHSNSKTWVAESDDKSEINGEVRAEPTGCTVYSSATSPLIYKVKIWLLALSFILAWVHTHPLDSM